MAHTQVGISPITKNYDLIRSLDYFVHLPIEEFTTTDLKELHILGEAQKLSRQGYMDSRVEYRAIAEPYPLLQKDEGKNKSLRQRITIYSLNDKVKQYFKNIKNN